MYYFGYQKNQRGEFYGVKFDADHAPSHRTVIGKHEISIEEFKWATWGLLKQKYPAPQEQEAVNVPSASIQVRQKNSP